MPPGLIPLASTQPPLPAALIALPISAPKSAWVGLYDVDAALRSGSISSGRTHVTGMHSSELTPLQVFPTGGCPTANEFLGSWQKAGITSDSRRNSVFLTFILPFLTGSRF